MNHYLLLADVDRRLEKARKRVALHDLADLLILGLCLGLMVYAILETVFR